MGNCLLDYSEKRQYVKSTFNWLVIDKVNQCNVKSMEVYEHDYSELIDINVNEHGSPRLNFNNMSIVFLDNFSVLITKEKSKIELTISSIIHKISLINHLSNFGEKFDVNSVLHSWDSDAMELICYIVNEELLKVEDLDGEWYKEVKRNVDDKLKKLVVKPVLNSKTPTSHEVDEYVSNKEMYENSLSLFNLTDNISKHTFVNSINHITSKIIDNHFSHYLDEDKRIKMEYLEDNLNSGLNKEKVYNGFSYYDFESFKHSVNELNGKFEEIESYI